jgi:hypothetical protein
LGCSGRGSIGLQRPGVDWAAAAGGRLGCSGRGSIAAACGGLCAWLSLAVRVERTAFSALSLQLPLVALDSWRSTGARLGCHCRCQSAGGRWSPGRPAVERPAAISDCWRSNISDFWRSSLIVSGADYPWRSIISDYWRSSVRLAQWWSIGQQARSRVASLYPEPRVRDQRSGGLQTRRGVSLQPMGGFPAGHRAVPPPTPSRLGPLGWGGVKDTGLGWSRGHWASS